MQIAHTSDRLISATFKQTSQVVLLTLVPSKIINLIR